MFVVISTGAVIGMVLEEYLEWKEHRKWKKSIIKVLINDPK